MSRTARWVSLGVCASVLFAGCYRQHTGPADAGLDGGVALNDGGTDSGPRTECPADIAGTWTLEWDSHGDGRAPTMDFAETGLPTFWPSDSCMLEPDCGPMNCLMTFPSPPDCIARVEWEGPCLSPRGVRNAAVYRYESSTLMYGELALESHHGTAISRFVARK